MKINAAAPVLDLVPAASSASPDGGLAGREFEVAVREVAGKANDRGGAPSAPQPENERVGPGRKDEGSATAESASAGADEDDAVEDASKDAVPTTAADLLGRLLAAAGLAQGAVSAKAQAGEKAEPLAGDETEAATAAGAAIVRAEAETAADALQLATLPTDEGTTFDGALEERLVITPLGAGSAEGKAPGKDAGRAGVGLEVLHMETHFEPRVDDVVLVEGAVKSLPEAAGEDALDGVLSSIRLASEGALRTVAQGADRTRSAGEAAGLSTRLDETLARLAAGEGVSDDAKGDAFDRQGARDDRRSEAKGADETRQASQRMRSEAIGDAPETGSVPAAGSMSGQIAERIVDAFRPAAAGQRAADVASGQTHLRMTAGGAALKTLTIQLQPENLGVLDVSMRLVDGRLTLELAASSAETAAALGQDRAGLKKLLEHAGFAMDEASIVVVARDAAGGPARAGAAPETSGQPQQGPSGDGRGGAGAGAGERGFARDPRAGERDTASDRRNSGDPDARSPAARSGSVFL